jgi:outer membrane protein assembly factor BamC
VRLGYRQGVRSFTPETFNVNPMIPLIPLRRTALALAAAAAVLGSGCSSTDNIFSGDKIDYKSKATKSVPLEIPPDLTQLARDGRYRPQSGVVSASAVAAANPAATNPAAAGANPASTTPAGTDPSAGASTAPAVATAPVIAAVAPSSIGEMRIERQGTQRWLVVPMAPEQLWPQLQTFWPELGFSLELDSAQTGLMETSWAENRAKIPQDFIRNTLGRVLDSFYSTSERDRFRTRVERTPAGSEVYISHRGMEEVFTSTDRELKSTVWVPRPNDPQLEAEFLSRLMIKLGVREEAARTAVANAPQQAPAARPVVAGTSSTAATVVPGAAALELDDGFDRAWRRVGLALDRTGFTVEDRDRAAGLYFVRYVDPAAAGQEDPNFFTRIFGGENKAITPVRYRLLVKTAAPKTTVSVLDASGAPDTSENARRIVALLVAELK